MSNQNGGTISDTAFLFNASPLKDAPTFMPMSSPKKITTTTALLLLLGALLLSSRTRAAEPATLSAPGISLVAQPNGSITVRDANGTPRMALGDYRFVWTPPETAGGHASRVQTSEGKPAIRVVYNIKNDATHSLRIEGMFTLAPGRVRIRYDLWGTDDLKTDGAMLTCQAQPSSVTSAKLQLTHWQRDSNGGIPFEVSDGAGRAYTWPDQTRLVLSPDKTNATWQTETAIHFPATKAEAGHFVAQGDLFLFKVRPATASAWKAGRPLSLDLWTDQPFNLWESASQPLPVHAELVNTSPTTLTTTLSYWVRDFDGKVVARGSTVRELPSSAAWEQTWEIHATGRGIFFVEVQANSGSDVAFSRTSVSVMPAYTFQDGASSLFGISGYFPEPSEAEAEKMVQRIGVRWTRQKQTTLAQAEAAGLRQNFHSSLAPKDAEDNTPAQTDAWIAQQLTEADGIHADYWEVCNEWNMAGGIGSATNAPLYVEKVLLPADARRKASGAKVKLMALGLAGGDLKYIDAMHAAGAWDHFDAFALHPGRGNYTPDFDGKPGEIGDHGDYWNFLGTIRDVKAKLAQYGDKPLWITEAYACTAPNLWWNDTLRHAAENVVLSYALAAAEGVRVMDWYQFNDSVWWNTDGANPDDPEFHYGLVNRDLSPKPSLLAYQTVAQALDGAKFVRYLTFADSQQKGLFFDTPHGPITILWHRADGYLLNTDHPKTGKAYATPEPWVDMWKTKVKVILPATVGATTVKMLDCLGRETVLPVHDGQVEVELDGAARIFYGIGG